jgi:hypothetical protein
VGDGELPAAGESRQVDSKRRGLKAKQSSGLRRPEGSDALNEKTFRRGPGKIDKHFGLGFFVGIFEINETFENVMTVETGQIEGSQKILVGKNLKNIFGVGSKCGVDHGLFCQDNHPVMRTLSGDVPAFSESLFDVAPGVNRKKPSHGFLISQFQGSFDDILFVFLRIETG